MSKRPKSCDPLANHKSFGASCNVSVSKTTRRKKITPSQLSAMSDTGEVETEDYLLENELSKLTKQLRNMDNDHSAYQEQVAAVIHKQNKEIKLLTEESMEIKVSLERALSTKHLADDEERTQKLLAILESGDEIREAIWEEGKMIAEIDAKVATWEKNVWDLRIKSGGLYGNDNRHVNAQKRIRVFENRLHQAYIRFNTQLANNAKTREEIDHLRHERAIFDGLYKKFLKQLDDIRQETSTIIEQATIAYEHRDEANNKMANLKDRSDKDQANFEAEMKTLQIIITHDNKLKEFMNVKAQERSEYKAIEAAKRKKKDFRRSSSLATLPKPWIEFDPLTETYVQVFPKQKHLKTKPSPIEAEKPNEDIMAIRSYEDLFLHIQKVTGENDIAEMVHNFIKKEDDNFALFNYVNELNNEVETMQEQIENIKQDIKKFVDADTKMETNRVNILKTLEESMRESMSNTEQNNKRLKEINKVLDQLKSAIQNLFKKFGCDAAPIRDLLGGTDQVTNNNVMMHLGVIEQQTNTMMSMLHFINHGYQPKLMSQKKRIDDHIKLPKPQTRLPLEILVPDTREELEMEQSDDEDCPLTHDEIKARVMRTINKKELSSGGGKYKSGRTQQNRKSIKPL